tara:strand:- start:132 stop:860 length:729 start_codon:yes stop_codon:yes gene_type:complete
MNRLEFFKWLDTHYTNAEHIRMVKEKFDNNSERFLDIEQSTAMDTELVNSIKESLVDGKRLIETGTEFGSFILNFINDIDDIETCEVDEEYYTIAKYRLKDTHINYHLKQSEELLRGLKLKDTDVFFLDAHGGGYDEFNDNPLTNELKEIKNQNIKPVIYIHDFGIEMETINNNDWYFEHESLDKKYRYRFDFSVHSGWKLDWDFIKDNIESIYGKDGYLITYPTFNEPTIHPVGWIKITKK